MAVQLVDGRYVVRSGFVFAGARVDTGRPCAQLGPGGTRTPPLITTAQAVDRGDGLGRGAFPPCRDLPGAPARDYCAVERPVPVRSRSLAGPYGDGWLVGDLRYDRRRGSASPNEVIPPRTCPSYRPPWVPRGRTCWAVGRGCRALAPVSVARAPRHRAPAPAAHVTAPAGGRHRRM